MQKLKLALISLKSVAKRRTIKNASLINRWQED